MSNYFLATLKVERVNANGVMATVNEKYLIDALSYTEAEQMITDDVIHTCNGECSITSIKHQKVADVYESADDYWYLIKVGFITIDEKTGKEKVTAQRFYQQASSMESALASLKEKLGMSDFVFLSCTQVSIEAILSKS